jgi:hypothetical protein
MEGNVIYKVIQPATFWILQSNGGYKRKYFDPSADPETPILLNSMDMYPSEITLGLEQGLIEVYS